MTSKDYFAKRNGGKTPQKMEDDGEFVGSKWCQKLMVDFARHKANEFNAIYDILISHDVGSQYECDRLAREIIRINSNS